LRNGSPLQRPGIALYGVEYGHHQYIHRQWVRRRPRFSRARAGLDHALGHRAHRSGRNHSSAIRKIGIVALVCVWDRAGTDVSLHGRFGDADADVPPARLERESSRPRLTARDAYSTYRTYAAAASDGTIHRIGSLRDPCARQSGESSDWIGRLHSTIRCDLRPQVRLGADDGSLLSGQAKWTWGRLAVLD